MRMSDRRWVTWLYVSVLALIVQSGCARVFQTQYFEVVGSPDPDTGIAQKNYYRMTVSGTGGGGVRYKLQSAYISSTTLDTLNGKLPVLPEADLSEANIKAFNEIKNSYLTAAKKYALVTDEDNSVIQPGNTSGDQDRLMMGVARQAWYSSLSDSDLISLGQSNTTDPYQFRKLVFYASATNINLKEYESQIDSIISKTSALVKHFRMQKESRDRRKEAFGAFMKDLIKRNPNMGALGPAIEVLFPDTQSE